MPVVTGKHLFKRFLQLKAFVAVKAWAFHRFFSDCSGIIFTKTADQITACNFPDIFAEVLKFFQ